jgi:hypothetical protein
MFYEEVLEFHRPSKFLCQDIWLLMYTVEKMKMIKDDL